MPLVNARQAAELTGKDRSTLLRAVSGGRLSATRDDRGQYLFDPAELERVYGSLRAHQGAAQAVREDAYAHNPDAQALEHERHSFEEERTFLRGMLEKQAEQVRLLTDQREREPARSPALFRWFRRA